VLKLDSIIPVREKKIFLSENEEKQWAFIKFKTVLKNTKKKKKVEARVDKN
jgi:hypothetical protein